MTELTHKAIQELLGAYALDATDSDERDAVEGHLSMCPKCRAEVQQHREVAALLASSGSSAPPAVWDRITASLEEAPPALRLVGAPTTRATRWAAVAAVAAAVAALLGIVTGVRTIDQDRRIDSLVAASRIDPLRAAAHAALADPASQRVVLRSPDGRIASTLVSTPEGNGYLLPENLPPLGRSRTYQLWLLVGEAKVSAAVLGATPGVTRFAVPGPVDGFAITEEDAPGAPQPTRTPIVLGFVRPV